MTAVYVDRALRAETKVGSHTVVVWMGFCGSGTTPSEVVIECGRIGSTLSGLCATLGELITLLFRSGTTLADINKVLEHHRFEPGCSDTHSSLPQAISVCLTQMLDTTTDFGQQTLSRPTETTPPQSGPEPEKVTRYPSHVSDESHSPSSSSTQSPVGE